MGRIGRANSFAAEVAPPLKEAPQSRGFGGRVNYTIGEQQLAIANTADLLHPFTLRNASGSSQWVISSALTFLGVP